MFYLNIITLIEYMSFLKNIFKGFFNNPSTADQPKESQYLPEIELPIDEEFTMNFKNNGGKFLYCETEAELQDTFVNILVENDWFESEAITFEKDIFPFIGRRPIAEIEPMELLGTLKRIENRGALEKLRKVRQRCGEVFRYAIITGKAEYNPAPDLAGHSHFNIQI